MVTARCGSRRGIGTKGISRSADAADHGCAGGSTAAPLQLASPRALTIPSPVLCFARSVLDAPDSRWLRITTPRSSWCLSPLARLPLRFCCASAVLQQNQLEGHGKYTLSNGKQHRHLRPTGSPSQWRQHTKTWTSGAATRPIGPSDRCEPREHSAPLLCPAMSPLLANADDEMEALQEVCPNCGCVNCVVEVDARQCQLGPSGGWGGDL